MVSPDELEAMFGALPERWLQKKEAIEAVGTSIPIAPASLVLETSLGLLEDIRMYLFFKEEVPLDRFSVFEASKEWLPSFKHKPRELLASKLKYWKDKLHVVNGQVLKIFAANGPAGSREPWDAEYFIVDPSMKALVHHPKTPNLQVYGPLRTLKPAERDTLFLKAIPKAHENFNLVIKEYYP